jgi:glycosyltransferase involved in cell wall biosynthesis
MKVLFSDVTYSYIFPGGKQVHAGKLFHYLSSLGVEVEYENWHNPQLKGDVVQFFGYNDFHKIRALKQKGYKLVYTHILDGVTNLPASQRRYHKLKNKLIGLLPEKFNTLFPWRILNEFDALIYMHQNDLNTAVELYNVDPAKAFVIPHAVDALEPFAGPATAVGPNYLVSVGSIVERKNAVFTARLCKQLNIPIHFIGHPFDPQSAYYKEFESLCDGSSIRYSGYVSEEEKLQLLKQASGFVLLSFGESGCISVYEAGAAGLPLLLSDLPWAKGYEQPQAISFCSPADEQQAAIALQQFYAAAQRRPTPSFTVHTWKEIAGQYATIYQKLLT